MLEELKAVSTQFECCLTIANMADPLHPLIYVSQKFTDVTGYGLDFAFGKNCSFLQGRLTDKNKILFMRKMFNEQSSCCVDLVNYKRNGDPFWNRLVMLPLRLDEGFFYIGFQHDVTQKKAKTNTEADLSSIQDSEICHKIKNPLSIVLARCSDLKKNNYNESKKLEIYSKLKEAIQRIDDFVIHIEDSSEFENWKY